MAEYIKREALVHRLKSPYLFNITQRIFEIISEIPAADVAPVVHGAWQVTDRFKACSVCGYAFARLLPDKYCPHCGAKMDGGADHADD